MFTDPVVTRITRSSGISQRLFATEGRIFRFSVVTVKCIVLFFLCFLCAATWRGDSPLTDNFVKQGHIHGEEYVGTALERVLIAYASVQAARGTLAVIQHSSLSLQPAGVGAVVATGRIVEPVMDVLTKVGDVLFVSAASLGIQKLLLAVSDHAFVWYTLIIATLFVCLTIFLPNQSAFIVQIKRIAAVVCFCAVLLRFAMVLFLLFSSWFFAMFLESEATRSASDMQASVATIQVAESIATQEKTNNLKRFFTTQIKSILNTIRDHTNSLVASAKDVISALLVEMIAMPLFFIGCIWLLWRLMYTTLPRFTTEKRQRQSVGGRTQVI